MCTVNVGDMDTKTVPRQRLHRNSVPCAVPGCKNNVRYSLLAHDYTQCAKCCNRFERDHPFMDHLSGMRGAKCNSLAFWKVLDDATIG